MASLVSADGGENERESAATFARRLSNQMPELSACALAVAWFYYLGYGPTLDPTFVAWMWRDDWAAYQWGFSFFRNAPWQWPLGSIPNLFYPHGTSIGFTDANPWMCVLFKLLSPLLPREFQFSGLWYLLCYGLQAWFGTKVCRALTRDPVQRALGGALFALTPVLPVRVPHIALCAQFFVTAGLWLNLRREPTVKAAQRGVLVSFVLLSWVAGTHAYLSVMLLALCLAYYVRLSLVERLLGLRGLLLAVAGALIATVGVYYLFGFIGWKKADLSVPGFGLFSADLFALVNSQGLSRFVPGLPFQPWQWEGYAYLGLGTLCLLVLGLARLPLRLAWGRDVRRETLLSLRRAIVRQWPLAIAVAGMAFYALSSQVTSRGVLVLDLNALYAPLAQITGTFRSSGRFAWPLNFLLIAVGVRALAGVRWRWLARAALLSALALSAAEQDPHRLQFAAIPLARLDDRAWDDASEKYVHLELVPLHLQWDCVYNAPLVDALSNFAYGHKLTFNSGNFMRKQPNPKALCEQDVRTLDPHTIYAVDAPRLAAMRGLGAVCGVLNGFSFCAAPRDTLLVAGLRAAPQL